MALLKLAAIKLIEKQVDDLFDRAAARYLGEALLPKQIIVGFKNELSLPGLFMAAAREEGVPPSKDIIQHLVRNATNYLDAYRAQTKAQVVNKVQSFLTQAELGNVKTDLQTVLGGELAQVWETTTNNVRRLIETEATVARNTGTLEGILEANADEGIEDPVVFFIVVRDEHLCDECKRLHLLDDEKTPRCYYLSELGHGYHKKGQKDPKLGGLHPNCRCTLVTMMPGYGFDGSGMVKFISLDHNEIESQRPGMKKSESGQSVFRGISHDEHEFIRQNGHILSDQRYCVPGEGTCFDTSHDGAESYVNTGRTSPPATSKPTYVLEVGNGADLKVDHRDGYHKTLAPIPARHIKAITRYNPDGTFEAGRWDAATGFTSTSAPQKHPWRHHPIQWGISKSDCKLEELHGDEDLEKVVLDPNAGYSLDHSAFGIWHQVNVHHRGERVGAAFFEATQNGVLKPASIMVDPSHRRQGIASAMYAHAEKMSGKKVIPGTNQTEDGKALWAGNEKNKQFGKAEALAKSDWPTSKYLAELERFGWVPQRNGKHMLLTNKHFTPARPMTISHGHTKRIGVEIMENGAKDMGLRWDHNGLRVDPKHAYAAHYRKAGLLPPDRDEKRTWTPDGHAGGHMDISKVLSTKPGVDQDWKTAKFTAQFASPAEHGKIPAIHVMDGGDGNHYALEGEEQLEAARGHGMTHVPVVTAR